MANPAGSEVSATRSDHTHSAGRWESIRKWFEKNWAQALFLIAGLALYLLLGLFLWWLLQRYVDPSAIKDPSKEATAKKDLLQALGLIMAGVAGAIGIFFTWRGQRITQESLQSTREQAEENILLTEQGQITERFTRAIDQLGSTDDHGNPRLEIRLGGIYALARIDKESPERAYHSTVMEILTAYVRENFRRVPVEDGGLEQDKGVEEDALPQPWMLPTDVRAIMEVMSSREAQRVPKEHRPRLLDFNETKLPAAMLSRSYLQEALFYKADLRNAAFLKADLRKAFLGEADLRGATFRGADLREAYLPGADLREAIFQEADLRGADLQRADLQRADLQDAKVTDEQLEQAKSLEGAIMPNGQKYEE